MKKILTLIVAVIDVALLVWIINSEPWKPEEHVTAQETVQETAQAMPQETAQSYSAAEELPEASSADLFLPPSDDEDLSVLYENSPVYDESSAADFAGNSSPEFSEEPAADYGQDLQSDLQLEYSGDTVESELSMADFAWYESDVSRNGFPPEAEQFTEYDRMRGGWKAYIKFDPDNSNGRRMDLLLYVMINGDQDHVTVECDWYWEHMLSEAEGQYTADEPSYYFGNYEDGQIHATGAGKMDIRYFYDWNGKEYAIGVMESQAGVKAILCMVR